MCSMFWCYGDKKEACFFFLSFMFNKNWCMLIFGYRKNSDKCFNVFYFLGNLMVVVYYNFYVVCIVFWAVRVLMYRLYVAIRLLYFSFFQTWWSITLEIQYGYDQFFQHLRLEHESGGFCCN